MVDWNVFSWGTVLSIMTVLATLAFVVATWMGGPGTFVVGFLLGLIVGGTFYEFYGAAKRADLSAQPNE